MLKNYLKLALKVLMRRKFFTAVSLFGICFTLVVLMVATALLDHVFAAHYPETHLDRTLGVYNLVMAGPHSRSTTPPGYRLLEETLPGLEGAERVTMIEIQSGVTTFRDGHAVDLYLKRTDAEFWNVMQFDFLEGEPFTTDDEKNARQVAVINQSTSRKLFGEESAIGRTIEIDDQNFRVSGVVRDVPFIRLVPFADVWVPLSTNKSTQWREDVGGGFFGLVVAGSRKDFPRLKDQFQDRLSRVSPTPGSGYETLTAHLNTVPEMIATEMFNLGSVLWLRVIPIVVAILFMLLPAVNLINLNLSRILERASEIGVRKSFGATRRELLAQFVVENVILTLIGGALGLVVSGLILMELNRSGLIPYTHFSLNFRIFAWGMAFALLFGFISGVWPAWRMSRLHPANALRGNLR